MSAMQKLLKITSIAMLVLGGLFIPLTVMNFIHAETFPGIIIAVLTALTALFDILLGFLGSTAANVPSRVTGLLPIIVMALIVSAASVLTSCLWRACGCPRWSTRPSTWCIPLRRTRLKKRPCARALTFDG